jgi:hypothetical protein
MSLKDMVEDLQKRRPEAPREARPDSGEGKAS